jgi:hypothetical protein
MTLRWTNTEKWKDNNFQKWSSEAKLLYQFICDNCDFAGFWQKDLKIASHYTGIPMEDGGLLESQKNRGIETAFDELLDRFLIYENTIWVINFLYQQKNLPLDPENNAHKGIFKIIASHKSFGKLVLKEIKKQIKIRGLLGADKPQGSPIGKGKGKGKEGGVGGTSKISFCFVDREPVVSQPVTIWRNGKPTMLCMCENCKSAFFKIKELKKINGKNTTHAEVEAAILAHKAETRGIAICK